MSVQNAVLKYNHNRKIGVSSMRLSIALASLCGLSHTLPAQTVSITVDASTTSVSAAAGGDDMKRIKNFLSCGSWELPKSETVVNKWLAPIGITSARGINLETKYVEENTLSSYNITTGRFTPGSKTIQYLSEVRQYSWLPYVVVGQQVAITEPPQNGGWPNPAYQKYARGLIRHVVENSYPGCYVSDAFLDTELTSPSWTPTENITSKNSPSWRNSGGVLTFSTDSLTARRTLRIDFSGASTTAPTYISFDMRAPSSGVDFQPVAFALRDSGTTNTGYSMFASPALGYGGGGSLTGFAWAPYPSAPLYVGVAGKTLVNGPTWQNICIKYDPANQRITLSRNDEVVTTISNISPLAALNRFELTNVYSTVAWQVRNFFVGNRPRSPLGDNFNDGNLTATQGPAWQIVRQGTTRSWSASTGRLILAGSNGSNSTNPPTLGVNLFPSDSLHKFNLSFRVRYPNSAPVSYNPLRFSILQKTGTSSQGVSIYANRLANAFGSQSTASGFARATYNAAPQLPGYPGEALGLVRPNKWESIGITYDPSNQIITVTKDGLVVDSFTNPSAMTKVNRFEIANYVAGQIPWEIDDVYAWYGDDPMPEVTFDVENEPDGYGKRADGTVNLPWWAVGEDYIPASYEIYAQYWDLYKAWATEVEAASREIPRPLRIGGPCVTMFSSDPQYKWLPPLAGSSDNTSWYQRFVADCAIYNVRLDDLSVHIYGDQCPVFSRVSTWTYPNVTNVLNEMQAALDANALDFVRINISEWGPDAENQKISVPASVKNADNVGAAWAAAFLENLAETSARKGSLNFLADSQPWSNQSFLSENGTYPKTLHNLAEMVSMMSGTRCSMTYPQGGDVGGFASADLSNGQVAVLAYNYNYDYRALLEGRGGMADKTSPQDLSVTVSGLPSTWTAGATVKKYVIDSAHGGAYRLFASGQTITEAASDLQSVGNPITVSVVGNSITLPSSLAEKSSVTLWIITKN